LRHFLGTISEFDYSLPRRHIGTAYLLKEETSGVYAQKRFADILTVLCHTIFELKGKQVSLFAYTKSRGPLAATILSGLNFG
jgi:hypothetical protein